MAKYLDQSGLSYFWGKVKAAITAVQTSLASHTGNSTVHITSDERTAWDGKVSKNGDTMTGDLIMVEKSLTFQDSQGDAAYLINMNDILGNGRGAGIVTSGQNGDPSFIDVVDGDIYVGAVGENGIQGVQIHGVSTPTSDTDAVNKAYVDSGLSNKEAIGAAATVQSNLDAHEADVTVHVTETERTTWNGKAEVRSMNISCLVNSWYDSNGSYGHYAYYQFWAFSGMTGDSNVIACPHPYYDNGVSVQEWIDCGIAVFQCTSGGFYIGAVKKPTVQVNMSVMMIN